jgi:hypothetical protein
MGGVETLDNTDVRRENENRGECCESEIRPTKRSHILIYEQGQSEFRCNSLTVDFVLNIQHIC